MIGRLLLILGIFFFVWIGYRFLKKTFDERVDDVEEQEAQSDSQPHKIEQIKACAYCKTHIPENEGINENGDFFCSYEHLDQYLEHKSDQ